MNSDDQTPPDGPENGDALDQSMKGVAQNGPEEALTPPEFFFHRTPKTPEVDFYYNDNSVSLTGDCDPDQAGTFFQPLHDWLDAFARWKDGDTLHFKVSSNYIGSSSLPHFRQMFMKIQEMIVNGKTVTVTWKTNKSNQRMIGYGRNYSEIIPKAKFIPIETDD